MPFAEVSDVVTQYQWDADNAELEAKLTLLLEVAHDLVSAYIGYDPTEETAVTKNISSAGKSILSVPKPLASFTEVLILDEDGDELEDITTLVAGCPSNPPPNSLFRWLEFKKVQGMSKRTFPEGNDCIAIKGDWGYGTSNILKQVTIQVVKHLTDIENVNELIMTDSNFGRSITMNPLATRHYMPVIAQVALDRTFKLHRSFGDA